MAKEYEIEELENMAEEEELEERYITMADENGVESDFVIDMYIPIDGVTYVVMYKLDENGEVDVEDDVYAFRAVFEDEELANLEEISDEEVAKVGAEYERILKELEAEEN